jgi:poly[(R)-3-hydroxyalkanoate] polymerase subunit PhaC
MDTPTGRALVKSPAATPAAAQTGVRENGTNDPSGLTLVGEDIAQPTEPVSYSSSALAEVLDRATHASISKLTMGLSPASLAGAYLDWLANLMSAPGKCLQLNDTAFQNCIRLQRFALEYSLVGNGASACINPLAQDKRFESELWQQWPFSVFYQAHLLAQQWWHVATTGVPGVSAQHERTLEFTARQILDVIAPSNFLLTNPELLSATATEGGRNLTRGFRHFIEDWERSTAGELPVGAEAFRPGHEVAITPGKVVHRNHLMELIQYAPATPKVHPEPVLIVPAWIMKYYVLDLSPKNSLIKYLVDQGFTVFAMSWKNPGPADRELSMEDYRRRGVNAALEAISAIIPDRKVHGVGYCLGGTLLAIAAAAFARDGASPFQTLSFLAAQVDFTEPGELQLFIDESQLRFLEDMMWEQGFLDAKQMSGVFQILRSNDLIWSRMMREYLFGRRTEFNDLMAWNADTTRMPYRMHSEYLRKLYLNNDLAEGRFDVTGRAITVSDIRRPIFCVGTVRDHIAPWRSVYKWNQLTDTEVTFVLTNGGHNAGILSEPGHARRRYQIATRTDQDLHVDPDTWAAQTSVNNGSWWPAWLAWLRRSSGEMTLGPRLGAPGTSYNAREAAPGLYVHQH